MGGGIGIVERFTGATLRRNLLAKKKFQPSDLTSSSLAAEVIPAPPAGYAVVVRRLICKFYAAGAAFTGVGANDNLVLRSTNAAGAILTQAVTGVGFLDTSPTAFVAAVAAPANDQLPAVGANVVLAYGASADGISVTSATGYLDVWVDYDLLYVGH